MPRLLFACIFITQCALASIAFAEEWDPFASTSVANLDTLEANFSGVIYSRFNQDLDHDQEGEHLQEFRSKFFLESSIGKPQKWTAKLSVLALQEIYPQYLHQSHMTFQAWEAYVQWDRSWFELSIGQQVRRWGRGIPSLWDILNPNNFSEFMFTEDEFTKIPVPMIRWTLFFNQHELELVGIPLAKLSSIPNAYSDWNPASVYVREEAEQNDLLYQLVDKGVYPGEISEPEQGFFLPEVGIRFTPRLPFGVLDIFAFYGINKQSLPHFLSPFLAYVGSKDNIEEAIEDLSAVNAITLYPIFYLQPQRQFSFGAAYAMPLRPFTLRLETAAHLKQQVYTPSLNSIDVPSIYSSINIDQLTHDKFVYSLSLIHAWFVTNQDLLILNQHNLLLAGLLRVKPFFFDFSIEARWLWDITLGDAWFGTTFMYGFTPDLQLHLGVNFIGGPAETPLNVFEHNDYAFLRLKWLF